MEQAERDGVSRSQNIAYTLPRTIEALTQVITAPLERIDPSEGTLQLIVLTPDAETAVAVSDFVYHRTGPQGLQVVPVTSANRAARLIEGQPVHAVAGPPLELQTLVQRSAIKLDGVKTIVLAWADETVSSTPNTAGADAMAATEALFAEIPRTAARTLVARTITPEIEQLIERYLLRARRVESTLPLASASDDESEAPSELNAPLRYLTVTNASRPVALQRLLDELDPPSAVVLVRSNESEEAALKAIRQLGYRRDEDPVRVSRADVPAGTHTVIYFDCPSSRAEIDRAAVATPVDVIAMVTPREINTLREILGAIVPLTLRGAGANARQRDRMLRDELTNVLLHGIASRELLALEPLLDQYDGIEIAAAAIRLLERERQKAQTLADAAKNFTLPAPRAENGERGQDRPPKESFGERGPRKFDRDRGSDRGGDRKFGGDRDRGERRFGGDRDRGERKFGGGDRKFGDRDRGERKFGGGDRRFGGDRDRGDQKFGGRDRKFGGDRERGERKFGGGERRFDKGAPRKFDRGGDRPPFRGSRHD